MANIADNVLRVYVNTEEEDFILIEQIKNELRELSYEYFEIDFIETDMLSIEMGTRWSAPVEEFQRICNTYGCHIIGVASEFGNRYVEAFDLDSEMSAEDLSNHFFPVEATNEPNLETLPLEGDENML